MITILLVSVFIIGYAAIAFEHSIHVNKAASALITGVLCWVIYFMSGHSGDEGMSHLSHHLGEISGIIFFLLGAMTIVELVDTHGGFEVLTNKINTKNQLKLAWIIGIITFFLSAVLDNLTTAIVMVSLLKKLIRTKEERLLMVGIVVIAANAGGAWSPIGDVTTAMLWIKNLISSGGVIYKVFLPSVVCLVVPMLLLRNKLKGEIHAPDRSTNESDFILKENEKKIFFYAGIFALLFVPLFKTITHLPPYMGMLFSLGLMWLLSELIHKGKPDKLKENLSVIHALKKIDTSSILFFLGILLAISALQSAGELTKLANFMDNTIGNQTIIIVAIGLLSAIVDNVPLVAAAIGMYDITVFAPDHNFWHFLAYCAGTGGSALIIGSAAGVAAMGMDNIDFMWYFKNISLYALLGYLAGAAVFVLQNGMI
jgi:Na+/H+ antiporter NhaD/arsenite permease-like protein